MSIVRLIRRCTLFCLGALALGACAGSPPLGPPPTAGDCIATRVLTNGTHTDIALPADAFDENHSLRAIYPDADHFLIGWGERDFYMAEDAGLWKGVKAILPPSPSVLHVVAVEGPMDALAWRDGEVLDVALSRTGARAMTAELERSLVRNDKGAVLVLGAGRAAGRSVFIADGRGFHLFKMCNHWAAARLREAGVPVKARFSFTASALVKAVERKTERVCPQPPAR
ncbi:MAG: DUF2459 domain-containing protein [Pseudomonadota bacterium]